MCVGPIDYVVPGQLSCAVVHLPIAKYQCALYPDCPLNDGTIVLDIDTPVTGNLDRIKSRPFFSDHLCIHILIPSYSKSDTRQSSIPPQVSSQTVQQPCPPAAQISPLYNTPSLNAHIPVPPIPLHSHSFFFQISDLVPTLHSLGSGLWYIALTAPNYVVSPPTHASKSLSACIPHTHTQAPST